MADPLILFDLTRSLSAFKSLAPTGVERVELAYAERFSRIGPGDVKFVAAARGDLRGIDQRIARDYISRLAHRWGGHDAPERAERALRRAARFLRGEPVRQQHEQRVARRLARRAREAKGEDDADTDGLSRGAPLGPVVGPPNLMWAREALQPVVAHAHRAGRPVIYLNVSHSRLDRPDHVERLCRGGDVRVVLFCHDTMPCDYPEFFREGSDAKHAVRVSAFARLADAVIANTDFTAKSLRRLMGDGPHPDVAVAHLGTDWPSAMAPTEAPVALPDTPYFIVVSTIEPRKNHLLLLQIWRRFAEAGGGEVPKLVIVGKRGWENDAIVAVLDRSASLWPYVYEAGALPDRALLPLMGGARALLMPSFVEGFGMPVVEAMANGVPVIASDIAAFREIGQDVPEFIDPLDGLGWQRTIVDYCRADSERRAAQSARLKGFRPLTWSAHFEVVDAVIGEVAARPARRKRA